MLSDISNGNIILLLVENGEEMSLLMNDNLDMTKQLDPDGREKVKSVSGSNIQMMGAAQVVMYQGSVKIPFTFQLVDKRIDLPFDDIRGANIYYQTGILTLGRSRTTIHKVLLPINAKGLTKEIRRLV